MFESFEDLDDMLNPLPFAKHDLRKAGSQRAMMIKARVTQILERQVAQTFKRAFDCARTIAHFVQEFAKKFSLHLRMGGASIGRAITFRIKDHFGKAKLIQMGINL